MHILVESYDVRTSAVDVSEQRYKKKVGFCVVMSEKTYFT